jgi:hypothetical protein
MGPALLLPGQVAPQALGNPEAAPDVTSLIGNPTRYGVFTFPARAAVAEILYPMPAPPQNGKPAIRWGRVLAQGKVRLPTNSELQINLRFDGLEQLNQLGQLYPCRVGYFNASELDFGDSHIHHLQGFKDLRGLDLNDTLITDKSLPQIGLFPKLRALNLTKTNITGSGFDSLKNLHNMRDLTIEGTSLKPGNIFKLKSLMPNLINLSVTRTSLPKEDAAIFKDLKLVKILSMGSNSHIDNDCIKYLSDLKDLRLLSIDDTSITEKVIPMLIKLPSLEQVKVRDTAFWKSKKHLTKYGKVEFVDIERFSGAPAEVFEPLH